MANLSDLIAQSTSDNPQKLVNLALATQMMDSGSGCSGSGLGGTNYIFVKGGGTPQENALELQAAYDTAKTMPRYLGTLSFGTTSTWYVGQTFKDSANYIWYKFIETYTGIIGTNQNKMIVVTEAEAKSVRTTVVVAPGTYTFGETKFPVNTPYINIVSLTGNADVILDGINVTASNVYLKGLNCGTNAFGGVSFINCNIENCIGGNNSFGYSSGGLVSITNSTFTDCVGGHNSFGKSGSSVTITDSTFTDCVGRITSFGSSYNNTTISDSTFTDCVGEPDSFGYSYSNIVSITGSTFTGCVGGGGNSFGYSKYSTVSITGSTFTDCVGGNNSFSTISATTKLYYCRLTSGTFETPEAGGKLVLCIDGNDTVVTTP